MEAQLHQTREAWLNYIAERLAPVFEKLGLRYRLSCVSRLGSRQAADAAGALGSVGIISAARIGILRFLFGLTWVTRKTCCRCKSPKSLATSWYTLRSVLRRVMARSSDESPGA